MTSTFVLVNCRFPYDARVRDEISKIPSVTNIYRTSGLYDLMVRVTVDAQDRLNALVSADIGKVRDVNSTVTMIIADTYAHT
jgi:DNA-binding Lrp family transcriptional regulator